MSKWLISILAVLFLIVCFGCQNPNSTSAITGNINFVWIGAFPYVPSNPEVGWAYYNILEKKSYVWDGEFWQIIAQDGKSIEWKGELSAAPSNPEENWAYFNVVDGNSYIYDGQTWNYMAKSGRDGVSGIMLWLGTYVSAPDNPSIGYCYYNSTDGCSYIWDGDSWEIIAKDGTSGTSIIWKGALDDYPSNPGLNWAYYNTSTKNSYIYNGSGWDTLATSLGGDTTVLVSFKWCGTSDTAPSSPSVGDAYYNSTLKASYVYDGSVWQQISKDGADGKDGTYTYDGTGYLITWKGSYDSNPPSPEKGWAYYNSAEGKSYIWDGSSWQIMAQDGKLEANDYSYLYVSCMTSEGNFSNSYSPHSIMSDVSFGTVGLNCSAKTSSFFLMYQSSSKGVLSLTGSPVIQISGPDADCFSVVQPGVTELETGTYNTDAVIVFAPNSIGEKTATITVPNDSKDTPDFSFTVKGIGAYWPKYYDGGEGDGNDAITCSAVDSDGNLYFAGYGFELVNNHSGYDWWIKKISKEGIEDSLNWNKKISFYDDYYYSYEAKYDDLQGILIDSADNVIVYSSYNIVKYSSDGVQKWTLAFSSGNISKVYIDSADNVYIVTNSTIAKYSSDGELLFSVSKSGVLEFDSSDNIAVLAGSYIYLFSGTDGKSKGSISFTTKTPQAICYDSNDNLYVAGYGDKLIDDYSKKDAFVSQYDTSLTLKWTKIYDSGHCDSEMVTDIVCDNGSIIVTGTGNDLISGASASDSWLKVFDYDGVEQRSHIFDLENMKLICIYDNDYYFTAGSSYSRGLYRISESGEVLETYGLNSNSSSSVSNPIYIISGTDGSIYQAGYDNDLVTSKSGYDWIIRKLK